MEAGIKLSEGDLAPEFRKLKRHLSMITFEMFNDEAQEKIRQFDWADFQRNGSHKIVSAPLVKQGEF